MKVEITSDSGLVFYRRADNADGQLVPFHQTGSMCMTSASITDTVFSISVDGQLGGYCLFNGGNVTLDMSKFQQNAAVLGRTNIPMYLVLEPARLVMYNKDGVAAMWYNLPTAQR
ncbi:hypothetical protein GPECTOR_126g522 [Gonium pectorale]|uniref:Uncharacterized protein n=1 Tax=Gonium pectorale TaxID=33097 RepID=A0A150FYH0_GONPE|nr:hypothetical protein GPECTOR_126g522 [Gonium pectorale]|eukprot:KXZ42666.1 hypothetical protein GPECTOR_126g522 [Gonium pectorale]